MTSSKWFDERQLGVLVLFDPDNRKQPVGYVTYSRCPIGIEIPQGKETVSPYAITDLFVIKTKRHRGYSTLLLRELARWIPELIVEGAYNYSAPATNGGWSALAKAFPNALRLGRSF